MPTYSGKQAQLSYFVVKIFFLIRLKPDWKSGCTNQRGGCLFIFYRFNCHKTVRRANEKRELAIVFTILGAVNLNWKEHMAHDTEAHHHTHNRLGLTFLLNIIITVAQIIGGVISGSLALISDAIHNLSDGVAVLLAYIADRLGHREKTAKHSFGYKRAEILAAFINALALIAISIYLMIEAVDRFANPQPVDFKWMLGLGILGFVANSFSVFLLHDGHNQNLNIKAAYLHLLGDALTSLAVVVGAVVIWAWGWTWIDPLVTLLISVYLLVHTFKLLKESTEILMQFAPSNINPGQVKHELETIPELRQVYHIHIWRLTDHSIHFEAHIELGSDLKLSETRAISKQMNELLRREFGITHVTLQFEYNCGNDGTEC